MQSRWMGVCVLAIATVWAGCNSPGGSGPGEGITASAVRDPIIQDIPKPSGFRLVDKNSQAYISGQYRIAKCEYVGPTERTAVKRFYEEYMPSAGFELRTSSMDRGTYTLVFESDREMCTVRIGPNGAKTLLNIELGPRPVGQAERELPPPRRRPD